MHLALFNPIRIYFACFVSLLLSLCTHSRLYKFVRLFITEVEVESRGKIGINARRKWININTCDIGIVFAGVYSLTLARSCAYDEMRWKYTGSRANYDEASLISYILAVEEK